MGQFINLINKIELEYKSHSMKEEKPKLNYTKQFNKKVLLFITFSMLLFTQCSKVETEEERISKILTGENKLVWNIHSNYWNEYSNSYAKTGYACEFNRNGYGFYLITQHTYESLGVKYIPSDSTWQIIDRTSIKFNYDTFKILNFNDTLFKLKNNKDTFYLIKEQNQTQKFFNGELYTSDKQINRMLHDR